MSRPQEPGEEPGEEFIPPQPPAPGENPDGAIGTVHENGVIERKATWFDISPPMGELAELEKLKVESAPPSPLKYYMPPEHEIPLPQVEEGPSGPDPYLQAEYAPEPLMPSPSLSFLALSNADNSGLHGGYIYQPPDTDGSVGPNHYVEWINNAWAVYNKSGTKLLGPSAPSSSIWSGFAAPCSTADNGDPIVLYDAMANRWLVSQFTASTPYCECIAVSQTSDPTGSWYRYGFQLSTTIFYDYPHAGVWPDGYYFNFDRFNGTTFAGDSAIVFQRDKMLTGSTTSSQEFITNNYFALMPSDFNGGDLPPSGSPDYYSDAYTAGYINLWKFHVDWTTPAASTFGTGSPNYYPNYSLTSSYSQLCPSTSRQQCIVYPGGTLESLGYHQMWRMNYRNFKSYESLVGNFTVDNGSGIAGLRWFQIRGMNGGASTPSIYQQGTYSPDSSYRWMGSIAEDRLDDMALGFSLSSSSIYPRIAYTGRLVSDTAGTMPQGEYTVQSATGGQQTGGARWGDYANVSIDPADDCTFWGVNEYLNSSLTGYGWSQWQSQIWSFKYPSCSATTCFSDSCDNFNNFNHAASVGVDDWAVYAQGGSQGNVIRASVPATVSDKTLTMKQAISVGPAATGTNLLFWHNYSFGTGDGGLIEASTDGGSTWTAINSAPGTASIFSQGGPVTTISSASNPLNGRYAWVGISASPTAGLFDPVQVNLSTQFANQNVLIRWRIGTDNATAGTYWSLDNVQVLNSATPTSPSTPSFSSVSCNSVTVSWGAVTGITSYTLYRKAGNSCSGAAPLITVSGTSYTDNTVAASSQYSYYAVANSACGPSTTVNCNTITTPACSVPPKYVPYSVTPTKIIKNDTAASNVAVNFDTSNCSSTKYHIIYGWGENLSAWTVTGNGGCAVSPSTSTTNWSGMPSASAHTFLWFLVVGDDGINTEGSWGTTYPGGAQEGGTSASSQCSCTIKNTSTTCGTP